MEPSLLRMLSSNSENELRKGAEQLAHELAVNGSTTSSLIQARLDASRGHEPWDDGCMCWQALKEALSIKTVHKIVSHLLSVVTGEPDDARREAIMLGAIWAICKNKELVDNLFLQDEKSVEDLCDRLFSCLSKCASHKNRQFAVFAVFFVQRLSENTKARRNILMNFPVNLILEKFSNTTQMEWMFDETNESLLFAYSSRQDPDATEHYVADLWYSAFPIMRVFLQFRLEQAVADVVYSLGNIAHFETGRELIMAYFDVETFVKGIFRVLKLACEDYVSDAAWAIRSFTRDKTFLRALLVQIDFVDGVIIALSRLLRSSDFFHVCDAACCIASLSATSFGQVTLLDHVEAVKMVQSLVSNALSSNHYVRDGCLAALAALGIDTMSALKQFGCHERNVSEKQMLEIVDALRHMDFESAVNASVRLRKMPVQTQDKSGREGSEQQGNTSEQQFALDTIAVNSIDGRFARSSSLQCLTSDMLFEHCGGIFHSSESRDVQGSLQMDLSDELNFEGIERDRGGEGNSKAPCTESDEKVNVVELVQALQDRLVVRWKPTFPEQTIRCRFVYDGGCGTGYRNVCTLERNDVKEDGKYYCEIGDLMPGREYKVLAIAKTIFKPCHGAMTMFDTKGIFKTLAAVPSAPDKITLSTKSRTALKIKWVQPESGGLDITGYEVEWCKAMMDEGGNLVPEESWVRATPVLGPGETSWKCNKLSPGSCYGFQVRAMNDEGAGNFCPPAFFYTSASVPSAPVEIRTVEDANEKHGGITLEWDVPNSNGDPISNYILEQQDFTSGSPFMVIMNGNATRHSVRGLEAGKVYKFRVKACNGEGAGQYSPLFTTSGISSPPAMCSAPILVKANKTSLRIRWTEPECNGAEITSYRVQLAEAVGAANSKKMKFTVAWEGKECTCELREGLTAGKKYHVRVIACNLIGESEPGAVSVLETLPSVPAPPTNISMLNRGSSTVTIGWEPPSDDGGAAIVSYQLEVKCDKDLRKLDVAGEKSEAEIGDLVPDYKYSIRIRCANRTGWGSLSEQFNFSTALPVPGAPGVPRLITSRPTSLSIRWEAPVGYLAIESYRVHIIPESTEVKGMIPEFLATKSDETRLDVAGLRPGYGYRIRVQAKNKSGYGDFGPAVVFRTDSTLPVPTNLQSLIVEGENDTLIAICSWDRPEGAGSSITYHVEIDEGGEGSTNFYEVYVGSATQHSHTVEPGKTYKFRVRAVSSTGSSGWSVIKGFLRSSNGQCVPDAVSARVLEDQQTVVVSWKPPIGSLPTTYQLKIDGVEGKKQRSDEGLDCVCTDLPEGLHRFQVRAFVMGKWRDWSKEVSLYIPGKQPLVNNNQFIVKGVKHEDELLQIISEGERQARDGSKNESFYRRNSPEVAPANSWNVQDAVGSLFPPEMKAMDAQDAVLDAREPSVLSAFADGTLESDTKPTACLNMYHSQSPNPTEQLDPEAQGFPSLGLSFSSSSSAPQPPSASFGSSEPTWSEKLQANLGIPRMTSPFQPDPAVTLPVMTAMPSKQMAADPSLLRANQWEGSATARMSPVVFHAEKIIASADDPRGAGMEDDKVLKGLGDVFPGRIPPVVLNDGDLGMKKPNDVHEKPSSLGGVTLDELHQKQEGEEGNDLGQEEAFAFDSPETEGYFVHGKFVGSWEMANASAEGESAPDPQASMDQYGLNLQPQPSRSFGDIMGQQAKPGASLFTSPLVYSPFADANALPLNTASKEPMQSQPARFQPFDTFDVPAVLLPQQAAAQGELHGPDRHQLLWKAPGMHEMDEAEEYSSLISSIPSGLLDDTEHELLFMRGRSGKGSANSTPTESSYQGGMTSFSSWDAAAPGLLKETSFSSSSSLQAQGEGNVSSNPAGSQGRDVVGVEQNGLSSMVDGDGQDVNGQQQEMLVPSIEEIFKAQLQRSQPRDENGQEGAGKVLGKEKEGYFPAGYSEQRGGPGSDVFVQCIPVTEVLSEVLRGTTYSEADFNGQHRELLWGLTFSDANVFLETARTLLLQTPRTQQAAGDLPGWIQQVLLRSREAVKRSLNLVNPANKVQRKTDQNSMLPHLFQELCHGTCVSVFDVDKQHFQVLAGIPLQDLLPIVKLARTMLLQFASKRTEVRKPAALLHNILLSSKDRAREERDARVKKEKPFESSTNNMTNFQGVHSSDLNPAVKKCVKELTSQTCFEDSDFEKPHVSLLLGMQPTVACSVLRHVKTRLAKAKRKDHRSPSAFLLGALTTAARAACNASGTSLTAEAQVEALRDQIRRMGAAPDF
ncbi:hypothetical protein GUITHDRAFT_108923 [Guillardia theta CCMP2712]|uniref:Fibronectin type-III domain-containing protein n=1 Tax=Guillardia theta (strain CCMP2712) TaxID=905079 RepID=L1J9U9_GUITC|nr:hypothetical protein GUITHDRAFT_108923 [Guillardia theta CCMP2712]EKX45281.1 hypothetical protein GUITHDRAFT_108923 [Guillardia theta CCMP2712]|eukprot:XP_005832261.1 hypothetical protein GUITHDRAFT_108923 [Guillardia theta CCMP2712]